tara:strand:- start:482 stop:889 length:408 start_codon:yes stop_codon:yes gene_type:complete
VDKLLSLFPNDVKIVFKNFPLRSHKQANKAALYAMAAGKQGKYKEMHKQIMSRYRELKNNEDLPLQFADEMGLDLQLLEEDMEDPALQQRIYREMDELKSTGLRLAVPKILINGEEYDRKKPIEVLVRELIDKAG